MERMNEITEMFAPREGFGAMGFGLPRITKAIADKFGDEEIRINVPYEDFNCKGAANIVNKDVVGVMPFSNEPIGESETTTFFYGERHVTNAFLPFLSIYDVYYVADAKIENGVAVFNLVKGQHRFTYL